LPINVVRQLIAERGAKISQGAFNQTILLIPMENNGQTKTAVTGKPEEPEAAESVNCVSSTTSSTDPTTAPQISPVQKLSPVSATMVAKTSPNQLILPKMPAGTSLQPLTRPPVILSVSATSPVSHTLPGGVTLNRLISPVATTSQRYPSNETVRNLLDKRKSTDDKKAGPPYKFMKFFLGTTKPVTELTAMSSTDVSAASMAMETSGGIIKLPTVTINESPPAMPILNKMLNKEGVVANQTILNAVSAQQCVITSISPAKLNTLLLQTSAAGAKTLPSLIKLPSKAALDSAVRAVVTSVTTSLPTVNIKVPSPTTLPSIAPRRNVTKTVQTMRSPIPVAPKLVSQYLESQANPSLTNAVVSSPNQSHLVPPVSTQSSTVTAVIQNKEGKQPLSKLTPQLVLTSKGMMQVGYVNPGLVAGASAADTQGAGVLTQGSVVPLLMPVASGVSKPLPVQAPTVMEVDDQAKKTVKPVIALNANGIPIGTLRMSSTTNAASSADTATSVTHVGHLGSMASTPSVRVSPVLPANKSSVISPVVNLQQGGLVLQGAMQLTNPLIHNPLGLNLLQHSLPVHSAQSTLLQTVTTSAGSSQQMINLNPLLLNANVTPTLLLSQSKPHAGLVSPVSTTVFSQKGSLVSPMSQLVLPGGVNSQLTVQPQGAGTPSPAQRQLLFQYPSAGLQLAALGSCVSPSSQTVPPAAASRQTLTRLLTTPISSPPEVKAMSTATSELPASSQPDSAGSQTADTKGAKSMTPAVIQIPKAATAMLVGAPQVQAPTVVRPATPQQQKLLLFSIGGQLVTGQGVPVTLSNGVLKVLPNGKVKINNQTLTHDQVKQTLSKINNGAAAMTSSPGSSSSIASTAAAGEPSAVARPAENPATSAVTRVLFDHKNVPVKVVRPAEIPASSANTRVMFDHKNVHVKVVKQETPDQHLNGCSSSSQEKMIKIEPSQIAAVARLNTEGKPNNVKPTTSPPSLSNTTSTESSGYSISRLVMDSDAKTFVVKKPVKPAMNGSGDSDSTSTASSEGSVSELGDGAIVKQGGGEGQGDVGGAGSENEAALNLLTLANQALGDTAGDKSGSGQ